MRHMDSPLFAAIVEVTVDSDGVLPVELIRRAYCASRSGPVALVLNGVSPQAVDRVLDEVVTGAGNVHGVLYCDPQKVMTVVSHLEVHGLAVVSTEALSTLLATRQARLLQTSEALRALATLSNEPSKDVDGDLRHARSDYSSAHRREALCASLSSEL